MRAGKLDRAITIQRVATTVNGYGTSDETWTDVATVRAQRVTTSTEEFIRAYGESAEAVAIFRTWWIDGVKLADRVVFEGQNYDIKETKEIGRREGLELRTILIGAA